MVIRYFRLKYPHTSLWLSGHSLGGSVASLVGIRWALPTVTFEAPGERLAAIRMGLVESIPDALRLSHITHVYNNLDPVAQGLCVGALSLCAQAGYAIEAKCHTSRVIMYDLQKPGWKLALQAHRMDQVLAILEDKELPVPEAIPQIDCQVSPNSL
jgi:lipase ATG15